MNETLQVLKKRYSCREFSDRRIDAGTLAAIAQAGVQSPSASNTQRWRVVMVTDRGVIDELEAAGMEALAAQPDKSMYERIVSRGGTLFYHATAVAIIAIDTSGANPPLLDCGIVTENMTIAAEALGVNTCICGLAGFAFGGGKNAYFCKKLKIPEGFNFGMSILLGYAKDAGGAPHEPDQSKIIYI